jgi:hypothetical protein
MNSESGLLVCVNQYASIYWSLLMLRRLWSLPLALPFCTADHPLILSMQLSSKAAAACHKHTWRNLSYFHWIGWWVRHRDTTTMNRRCIKMWVNHSIAWRKLQRRQESKLRAPVFYNSTQFDTMQQIIKRVEISAVKILRIIRWWEYGACEILSGVIWKHSKGIAASSSAKPDEGNQNTNTDHAITNTTNTYTQPIAG